ncbi:MAG: 50S ribosomal protein L25 [Bdellovibrionaceae bacterium]|nr:50S ribosomal protein L25 [Pseudobdellovibrionaceae bacterium]
MSQQRFDLNVESRQPGKGTSRGLRNSRRVPAVVYGSVKSQPITLEEGAIRKYNVRAFENALFTLKSEDKALNNVVVLMKSVQVHPLTRNPRHVDLFALDLKKAVRISIEIKVEGKAAGIADGGLLNVVNRQIEIECLPTEIPDGITVDVSALGVGDSLHVSDLTLPEGVKLISSPDTTIAVVNLQEEEAAATPAADAAAAPAAAAAAPAKGAAAPAAPAKK